MTLIQMAIAFVTRHPAVTSAIVGPRTMDAPRLLPAADGIVLSDDVLDRIDAIVAPGVTVNVADNVWNTEHDGAGRGVAPAVTRDAPSFGIMTAPSQVDYGDVLRVWRDADAIPEIEHAWLFDHLMPIGGDPERTDLRGLDAAGGARRPDASGCASACWSPATASGRPRCWPRSPRPSTSSPAGGSTSASAPARGPAPRIARREYDAHGLPFHDFAHSVESLAEACAVIRRLWTEDAPFDFDGAHVQLTGAFGSPKPVQRPHPPIMIGGRTRATAARGRRARRPVEHPRRRHRRRSSSAARCWTATAPRSVATRRRSPARSTCRSPTTSPPPPAPRSPRRSAPASGTSSSGCAAPYPDGVARWVADELIRAARPAPAGGARPAGAAG